MPNWIAEPDDLNDFTMEVHTGPEGSTPGDRSKPVYWIGEGPGVVVMPEANLDKPLETDCVWTEQSLA